ncbi:c-type cytochrome domain-containing protein [Verrucomicrobium spinosum]|uniref:c-type cytochrome domain-containing protein n=1 Tax=Verrucomicrobium spinosum TaxID=2736 RepID=UPI0009E69C9A|nr:c-type cytochrome domain-containing protein [Verrucomicrobium spinosum]
MTPAAALASLLFPIVSSSLVGAGPDLGTFVSERCLDCHDDSTKKGGFSMEHLDATITPANAKDWLKVLQQIERQNMPPADKDQPPREERHTVVQTLEDKLVAHARGQVTAVGSAAHRPPPCAA